MPDDQQDPRLRDLARAAAPGIVDNVTAAILSGLHTNPVIAAGAGGFIGLAVAFDQATGQRRVDRLAKMLEDASEEMGGPDVLAHRALANDQTAELTRRILEAGARTTLEDKLRALGRVLTNALEDTADIDHAILLASALSDLEAPHIRVLRYIERTDREGIPRTNNPPPGSGVHITDIRGHMHNDRAAVTAFVAQLSYHGLIVQRESTLRAPRAPSTSTAPALNDARYSVTELGTELLDLLTDHAPND